MKKRIKLYLCIVAILSTMMGYGQGQGQPIDGSYVVIATISRNTNTPNKVDTTVAVTNTKTNAVSFLYTIPVTLFPLPPITAPAINIQQILSNPYSSEEDKAKAAEALAIEKAQAAQAEAAMAQIQMLIAWVQAQAQAQAQAQDQAQAQAQAQALLTSLQQLSQSIENGGGVNNIPIPNTTKTWYMDNDGDGWHSASQARETCPGPGWCNNTTKGLDCNDGDATKTFDCSSTTAAPPIIIPWFLDNDGDDYFGKMVADTKSPPGIWINNTKGPDCNDTNPAIGINCGTPSAPKPPCSISCPIGYILNVTICACDNCSTTETTKADKATKLANIPEAKTKILQLQSDAKTKADETNFLINTDNTGVNTTTAIAGGVGNTTPMTIGATTQVTVHAHPDNTLTSVYPAHSAGDIYGLSDGHAGFNNYDTSITAGITDAYALIIEDATAFATYTNNYTRAACTIKADFIPKTSPADDFDDTYNILYNQGESDDEAYASALAYFLSLYNTGVGLYNSKIGADGATMFKKKKTIKVITPAVPASGSTPAVPAKTAFVKKDC